MKKWVLLLLTLLLVIPGCASNESSGNNPVVTVKMADGGTFQVELYPDTAPNTVNNFISLVERGFYDGLTFHRVEQGLLIQGGDPNGNGTGGPGYTIQGEFPNNSFENDLKHTEGVISMGARHGSRFSRQPVLYLPDRSAELGRRLRDLW